MGSDMDPDSNGTIASRLSTRQFHCCDSARGLKGICRTMLRFHCSTEAFEMGGTAFISFTHLLLIPRRDAWSP